MRMKQQQWMGASVESHREGADADAADVNVGRRAQAMRHTDIRPPCRHTTNAVLK